MPITRSVWIDDDGSGTTGTPINNAELQKIYNAIDAFVPVAPHTKLNIGAQVAATLTAGFYDNYRPAGGENNVGWLLFPQVASGLTGIQAEADGAMHLIVNTGSQTLLLFNQHANGGATNKIIAPGYANYTLTSWSSIWVVYSAQYVAWIALKP